MPRVGNLSVDVTANTASFERELDKATRALGSTEAKWGRSLQRIGRQFGAVGDGVKGFASELFSVRGAFTALVGTLGVGSIAAMAKEAVDAVGGLGELAQQLGISTDTLQAFQYAATQVGLSAEEMQVAIGRLTRTIGDAANGEKAAVDTFKSLGINVRDAGGLVRSTEDVLRDVADALAKIEDPASRASLAVDVFGKAGQKLMPFLESGARGIDDLVNKAKGMGLIFSEEVIAGADEASDKLATMSKVLSTQLNAALVNLAPLLTGFAEGMVRASREARLFLEAMGAWSNGPDAEMSLDALDERLGSLVRRQKDLIDQEHTVGGTWLDNVFGAGEARRQKLREIADEITQVKSLIDQAMLVEPAAGSVGGDGSAPQEAITSSAEKQIERIKQRIAEARSEIETFNLAPIDQQVAGLSLDFDQSIPGMQAFVAELSGLILQLDALKVGAVESSTALDGAVAKLGEGIKAHESEAQEIARIYEATRTPAEKYADEVERLTSLLGGSAENQELLNRAIEQAGADYEKVTKGASTFRDEVQDFGNAAAASISDAALEADNFNDAIGRVLESLGKMALNKFIGKLFDFGLDALFGPAAATGGPRSGRTIVGERGMEMVDLPAGSYVHPATRTAGMMRQGVQGSIGGPAGVTINAPITVNGSAGTPQQNRDLAEQMSEQLDRLARRVFREELGNQKRVGGLDNPLAAGFPR